MEFVLLAIRIVSYMEGIYASLVLTQVKANSLLTGTGAVLVGLVVVWGHGKI